MDNEQKTQIANSIVPTYMQGGNYYGAKIAPIKDDESIEAFVLRASFELSDLFVERWEVQSRYEKWLAQI